MTARGDLRVAQRLARSDPQLLADEVDARDLLGHRVLDLQARVDLEEGDRAVLRDEELARPGPDVAGLAQDGDRALAELPLLVGREERCRRLLDELLMTPLQRAVARGDDDDAAVRVGEALRLDVPRGVQVPLDEALAPAEGRGRLAHGGVVHLGDLVGLAGDLQPAATATERRLDGDGQAVHGGEGRDLLGAGHRVRCPGHERRTGAVGDVPRAHLVSEGLDGGGRRADPHEPGVDDGLGEAGVLGEEAVPRVHGVGARAAGDLEELGDVEVRLGRARPPEGEGLVGQAHVQRLAVGVGVDGDAGHARIGAGPGDADGDLTSVGDEHLADGGHGSP